MTEPADAGAASAPADPKGRSRRVGIVAAAGVAFLAIATFLGWALQRDPDGRESAGVGQPAATFTLPLLRGGDVSFESLRGKPVFVYFWASWCIPCREETPFIERAYAEWAPKGVQFLGINIQDAESDALAFLDEFRPDYTNARDETGRTYIEYGVYGVPEAFFIDSKGIVVERWVGGLSEEQLSESLGRLVSQ